ncbi:class I SAM-dependent methyltransferase [Actinoplanes sp. NPDC051513]|uniref:class I SAM-dependent methyltransferase n=1 Tax=Actinoplanes sp. NPDC051513 TaxID=3363908 RepID=UPI0037BDFF92
MAGHPVVTGEYDDAYRAGRQPWEIGGPQPALAAVVEHEVKGPKVLDAGCGTGDLAIALARRGHDVTAVDVSAVAIAAARGKADAAGLTIHFDVQDATRLSVAAAPFDSVLDSGLLHSLPRLADVAVDDYLALLPGLVAPGGLLFVLAVSAAGGQGFGVTEEFLRESFSPPAWAETRIEETTVAAEPGDEKLSFPAFLLRAVRAS